MAVIEARNLLRKLGQLATRYGPSPSPAVLVGYTQSYAIYVHENLEAHHPVGQAKYLEQPFRMRASGVAGRVAARLRQGLTLEEALLLEGLGLRRDSQLLCPVEFGFLKGSAFERIEGRAP